MLAQKIKIKIGDNKMLVLHLPDMASGDVEVIILKEEKRPAKLNDIMMSLPRHKVGEISNTLRREEIYSDAR